MKSVTLRGGPPVHPYVFSKRILSADRSVNDGDLVEVKTREGRSVGWAFAHRGSMVALRMLTWNPEDVPDELWLRERIKEAEGLRKDVLALPDVTNAWRIAHAEGDGLSGLVVDRYADTAVVSLFSLGWHRRFTEVERVLREECGVEDVVPRVDRRTAEHEGFDWPLRQDGEAIEVHEHGVRFLVNPHGGHKTGFFLDQRDNRQFIARIAKGRTVFDGMTYTGGFAIAAAKGGAASVTAMDLDEDAVVQVGRNAERNGVDVAFEHGDVFNALRTMKEKPASERPEVLIVDPPKWAKERAGLGTAMRRYADLNRLALEAVRPDGIVCTSSCSGLVSEEAFLRMLQYASYDTKRALRLMHVGGAGSDHPIASNFPESRYLKCVILQVGPEGSGPGNEEREDRGGERRGTFRRDDRRDDRHGGGYRDDRGPRRDDRGPRRDDRRGGGGYGGRRDDRGPRRDDRGPRRDDRGPRRDDRRGGGGYGGPRRDDRGPRRDDRGPRRDDRRGGGGYGGRRDDRGPRRDDSRGGGGYGGRRDDRGPRRDDRGPRRDDRGPRRDDRGPRRDDRGPRRDDRGPRKGGYGGRRPE